MCRNLFKVDASNFIFFLNILCLKHVEFKVHTVQSHVCTHVTKVKYMTKSVLRLCVECNRNCMSVDLLCFICYGEAI